MLAAIERGQCTVEKNAFGQNVVEDDKWIRTSRNDGGSQGSSSSKAGGGYHY
jgi:hypothetical protein